MPAIKEVELIIPQGTTFLYEVTYEDPDTGLPIDITGYAARLDARVKVDDAVPVYSASSLDASPDLTISGPQGKVLLTIPDPTTAAFSFKTCGFDLEIVAPITNQVIRLVKGIWILDKEYTRP